MTDILLVIAAVVAVFFIMKIAFKILKFLLLLGVVGFLLYNFGVLEKVLDYIL